MITVNYAAAIAAAVGVVAFAAAYYTALAPQAARVSAAWAEQSRSPGSVLAFELGKSLVIAFVLAGLSDLLAIRGVGGALALALVLWLTFPVLLLAGSVVHEKVAWRLAAIHAGDWLAKLLIIAVVVTVWR